MANLLIKMFLLVFTAAGFIGYDVSTHGSLEASRTGRALKNAGILIYVKQYYDIVEEQTLIAYRWGKKNFPYEEYNQLKNKTVEVSKNVWNKSFFLARDGYGRTKQYIKTSFKWVSDYVSLHLSDEVTKFFHSSYLIAEDGVKKFVKLSSDYAKWCRENINITREKITWENFEKIYFGAAQQVKVYYSNVSNWISRKVVCLMKS